MINYLVYEVKITNNKRYFAKLDINYKIYKQNYFRIFMSQSIFVVINFEINFFKFNSVM